MTGTLWLSSVTNALISIVLTFFTLWFGKYIKAVSDTVDLESVTMADYTVVIKPANDELWEEFRVGGAMTRRKQKVALQQRVKQALETAIPGSAIAEIGEYEPANRLSSARAIGAFGNCPGWHNSRDTDDRSSGLMFAHSGHELAMWIAWNEEESFRLWNAKKALLFELEAALKRRRVLGEAAGTDCVKQVQVKLEKLNASLDSVSHHNNGRQVAEDAHFHTPVAVFATFESDKSHAAAVKMKQLKLPDGMTVSIKSAPEPETVLWRNLQYTRKQRRIRVVTIILCTVAVLLLGVWLIVLVRMCSRR